VKYRYLTFDCYGTLVDWRTGIEEELHAVLGGIRIAGQELLDAYVSAEKNEEMGYRKYREVLRRTAISLSGTLGVEVSAEAAESFAASVPKWPAFTDAAEFLRDAGRKGYKRFILSNVDDDLLEGTIANNGLEVDGYVTAEQVGSYKPGEGHWLEFMRRTGAAKSEILHVAQSVYHDIVPAIRMGVASAWVNRYNEQLPPGVAPSMISDTLGNLGEALG
jgi:2-haloalkanoic acid dehalogenase type II